jgi:hypothetical protein
LPAGACPLANISVHQLQAAFRISDRRVPTRSDRRRIPKTVIECVSSGRSHHGQRRASPAREYQAAAQHALPTFQIPNVEMTRGSPYRVAIANANVPNMLGQISAAMGKAGLNIRNMVKKSRGEMAYTLVDSRDT